MADSNLHIPGISLGARIGRGGMADVFVGQHLALHRRVAVKVLHAHLVEHGDIRRRFHDEAAAVARLRHPNIVQVHDFGLVDDRPYIVMELVEGSSLADVLRVRRGRSPALALGYALPLVGQLADALDHAHAEAIIHRDLKPANVILSGARKPLPAGFEREQKPRAVLTDFGIARIMTATSVTASGTLLGTPAYMAPEQVTGKSVDARADVYSLGVVVHEILAGKPPFEDDSGNAASLMFKHVHDSPPKLAGQVAVFQPALDIALAKQPEARYLTAGDLARDLYRMQAGGEPAAVTLRRRAMRGQPAAPAGTPEAGQNNRRRRRLALLGGVLALLLLAGLGTQALRAGQRSDVASSTPTGETQVQVSASETALATTNGEPTRTSSQTPSQAPAASQTPTIPPPTATSQPTRPPSSTPPPTATSPPVIQVPTLSPPTLDAPDV